MADARRREGFFYAFLAYGAWGLVPLYFRPLAQHVPALEILAHRVVWTLVFLGLLITLAGRWRALLDCFRTPSLILALLISSLLIATNWLVYILCVAYERIVHASLGYFVTPFVSLILGMIVFRERPRPLQWLAIGIALLGVTRLLLEAGDVPWLGLSLAFSFGFYGLVRKLAPVDGLLGLSVETIVLTPFALVFLIFLQRNGALTWGSESRGLDLLIACSGIVTAIPLLCFGQAARRLPLTSLGFLQYLSPSLQFLLAVLFGEPFTTARAVCFGLIWLALIVFSLDGWRQLRRGSANVRSDSDPSATDLQN